MKCKCHGGKRRKRRHGGKAIKPLRKPLPKKYNKPATKPLRKPIERVRRIVKAYNKYNPSLIGLARHARSGVRA